MSNTTTPMLNSVLSNTWDSSFLIKQIDVYNYYDDSSFSKPIMDFSALFNYDTINKVLHIKEIDAAGIISPSSSIYYDSLYNPIKEVDDRYGEDEFFYTYNNAGFITSYRWLKNGQLFRSADISYTTSGSNTIASYKMDRNFFGVFRTMVNRYKETFDKDYRLVKRVVWEERFDSNIFVRNMVYNYDALGNLSSINKDVFDSARNQNIYAERCLDVLERESIIDSSRIKNRFFNSNGMKVFNQMLLVTDSAFSGDCMDLFADNSGTHGIDILCSPPRPAKRLTYRFPIYYSVNGGIIDNGYMRRVAFTNIRDQKNRYTTVFRPSPYIEFYNTVVNSGDTKLIIQYYK